MKQILLENLVKQAKQTFKDYELYLIELDKWRPHLHILQDMLSDEEKKQLDKKITRVREQFIAGHGILRYLLSQKLSIQPESINFLKNPWDKPYLSKKDFPHSPYFNISHDKDQVLIGFSSKFEIGVDLMLINLEQEVESIAKRYYSAEEQKFLFSQKGHHRLKSFYYIFCQKEALIKAHGKGLSLGLENFSVNPDFTSKPELRQFPQKESWFLNARLESPIEIENTIAIVCLLEPQQE